MTALQNTLNHLRLCQRARTAGYAVSYTTDPAWLVQQAINRRGGWLDDPGCFRGSCMPVNGKYPKRAIGETYNHLRQIAYKINRARVIVRDSELGEWRKALLSRIPERITTREDC
jgi:hypothetical protein